MRNLLPIALLLMISLVSCKKEDNTAAELQEEQDRKNKQQILSYISSQNLDMQEDESGMYYKIEGATGPKADTLLNQMTVKYVVRLLDGTIIDDYHKVDPVHFSFGSPIVLAGIQKAMRKMSKGNTATLLLPNTLAYGSRSNTTLPPFSVVRVDLELVDLQTEDEVLQQYISDHGLTVTKKVEGMYFVRTNESPLSEPINANQNITVSYIGSNVQGHVFDSASSFEIEAGSLGTKVIKGWTLGIPLMKTYESGLLLIPSSLAYGSSSNRSLPPFTPLIFDITVLSATNPD